MNHQSISIWQGLPYPYEENGQIPTLDTYLLKGTRVRPAVLICPGGGYNHLSTREAEPIAIQFNAAGFHAFVLNYSVIPCDYPQPLLDLARSLCLIRNNAANWFVDPNKIAICGFSAGGHLTASLGVHWNKPWLQESTGISPELTKPNALILSYPVITAGEFAHHGSFQQLLGTEIDQKLLNEVSIEHQVGPQMPPTFIWHTCTDRSVPVENSLILAQRLREAGQNFELHIYPEGPHGLALATPETEKVQPGVESWLSLCLNWLNRTFA